MNYEDGKAVPRIVIGRNSWQSARRPVQAPTEFASSNIANTCRVSEVHLPQPCIQSVTVLYRPCTARAQFLYLRDLMHPIQFVNKTSGTVGITIQDLLNGKTADVLVGSELLVECLVQNNVTLRLNVRFSYPFSSRHHSQRIL